VRSYAVDHAQRSRNDHRRTEIGAPGPTISAEPNSE
jgi:hypothetical protein